MDNKIIAFDSKRKKVKARRYELKAQISVYISRNNDSYDIDWSSPFDISLEDIYQIFKSIFNKLKKEVQKIEYKEKDIYNIEFTLLYYENGTKNIKYICNPPTITKEKLAEYLWVSLNIYDMKEKGTL